MMHPFLLLFLCFIVALQLHTFSIAFTPGVPSLLYLSARIFSFKASYNFTITRPVWHWIHLHSFLVKSSDFDLTSAVFSVHTDELVLFHTVTLDDPASRRAGAERASRQQAGEQVTASGEWVSVSSLLLACATSLTFACELPHWKGATGEPTTLTSLKAGRTDRVKGGK